jgi:hypothetical protein
VLGGVEPRKVTRFALYARATPATTGKLGPDTPRVMSEENRDLDNLRGPRFARVREATAGCSPRV